jgi:hypothetical protein
MSKETKNSFEEAGQESESSLVGEFFHMLRHNKKYWLLPIVIILLLFGLLILLGGSAAAPFIYTLF